jgi:hypothetical protein
MARSLTGRVDALAWGEIGEELDEIGAALTGKVLTAPECRTLAAMYGDDERFRSTVDMGRHRFGEGEYRYLSYPLPEVVAELRAAFWPHLLPIARSWAERLGQEAPWPDQLGDWLDRCHDAGQTRPTPLLLHYEAGGWNALHRDLYGDLVFPLQVVLSLSQPGEDHDGGELVVVEQRPRAQSRATTISIPRGHAVVFTTRDKPVRTQRGWSKGPMRHGVSVLRSGERHALGLIFHDAA